MPCDIATLFTFLTYGQFYHSLSEAGSGQNPEAPPTDCHSRGDFLSGTPFCGHAAQIYGRRPPCGSVGGDAAWLVVCFVLFAAGPGSFSMQMELGKNDSGLRAFFYSFRHFLCGKENVQGLRMAWPRRFFGPLCRMFFSNNRIELLQASFRL